jgi:carbamoyl-phosphate synthase small subunit
VQRVATGKVEITSQNHNFAVAADSLTGRAAITHVNLNDGVCEGMRASDAPAFGVQYHPEAGPGPHDSHYLFAEFASLMAASARPRREENQRADKPEQQRLS